MSLADLQRAVAELVCDPRSIEAYRRDGPGWLATRELPAHEKAVLRGLDHDDLGAFHDIHTRDRAYFLEAVLPLTVTRLGGSWWRPYFATHPFGDDDTRVEARRFTGYLDATHPDPAAASLARFEVARSTLLDAPVFRAKPGTMLRDPARPRLAPGLAAVDSAHHIPTLVDDPHAHAPEAAGVALLRRDHEGVTAAWHEGCIGEILASVRREEYDRLRALLRTRIGKESYLDILSEGVFV